MVWSSTNTLVSFVTPEAGSGSCSLIGSTARPVFSRSWRTPTVLALARQMRKAQDLSSMPILADALEDAGCDNESFCATAAHPASIYRAAGCWTSYSARSSVEAEPAAANALAMRMRAAPAHHNTVSQPRHILSPSADLTRAFGFDTVQPMI